MTIAAAVDAMFADVNLAEAATYVPLAGGAVSVRVIRRAPDQLSDFGESRYARDTAVFDIPVSAVAAPVAGDVVVIGSENFVVQGEPQREDVRRLIWTLDTRPQ